MSRKVARDIAMRMLYAADLGGEVDLIDLAADDENGRANLDAADWDYIRAAIAGHAGARGEIDERIEGMANGWRVERIARVDLAILRLAVYELFYDKAVPESVVINEAVRLAKKYGAEKSGAFVNGVLGGIARTQPDDMT
jgi:N utilization substance protein B